MHLFPRLQPRAQPSCSPRQDEQRSTGLKRPKGGPWGRGGVNPGCELHPPRTSDDRDYKSNAYTSPRRQPYTIGRRKHYDTNQTPLSQTQSSPEPITLATVP